MNLFRLFKRKAVDPHTAARERFDQAFASFNAEIKRAQSAHGRVNDARKAKQDAVHAALAGGRR